MFVVNGENLVIRPFKEIRKVETFLGLRHFFRSRHFIYPKENNGLPCFMLGEVGKCMGNDKGRKHPELKKKTFKFLNNKYQPMVKTLQEKTGISLKMSGRHNCGDGRHNCGGAATNVVGTGPTIAS